MSHQSGISAAPCLESVMQKARSSEHCRSFKVRIEDERLYCRGEQQKSSSLATDYNKCINSLLVKDQCCYLFIRLDSKNSDGYYEWILVLYSPDNAAVREKMLYASTKATIRQLFGSHLIKEDLYGSSLDDVNYNGYLKHMNSNDAPPPLTMSEMELSEIKKSENKEYGLCRKAETLPGLSFPVQKQLLDAFNSLKNNKLTYIQMGIDTKNEEILLTDSLNSKSIRDIAEKSNNSVQQPRYHIIDFHHKTREGKPAESIVFFYTMPGYSCSVKDRMLYSSCKGSLIDYFEKNLKPIAKKIEAENLNDLSETMLMDELYPPVSKGKEIFAKPKGPGRR